MSSGWMYYQNGMQFGPVTPERLRELASDGNLKPTDLVWRQGLADWIAASRLNGLFTPLQAPPPINPLTATVPPIPMGQAAPPPPVKQTGWNHVIAHCREAVVVIETPGGIGSGLVVRPDGFIVTNRHVVEGHSAARLVLSNHMETKGVVVDVDDNNDLALMKAILHTNKYLDLEKHTAETVHAGEDVLAIGHPAGLRFTSTKGIVSVPRQKLGTRIFVQHDVSINPGNSGGPLLDGQGRLVGINTLSRANAQNLNFAIPAATVRKYVQAVLARSSSGALAVPSDEEIQEIDTDMTPDQAILWALNQYEGKVEPLEAGGYSLYTTEELLVFAQAYPNMVECMALVAELNEAAMKDANFLLQLLKANDTMIQPKFVIDDNNTLWLTCRRFNEGLDPVEAHDLVGATFAAVKQFESVIIDYIQANHLKKPRRRRSTT